MKCDNCKFECGGWECSSDWNEYYLYECEKGLPYCEDDEDCECFEEKDV